MAASGMPAAATINSLKAVGIDFSVPESDLKDWLGNPDFTPYPAISQSLLTLLAGHRIKRSVFIDVIVFDYEHTHGVASPRKVADVKPDVLRKSVLQGYNERYGASEQNFQGLLTPQDVPQPPTQPPTQPPAQSPVLTAGLTVEGATRTDNGVIFVDTDNPQITTAVRLMTVHADWANGMVPQELHRHGLQWQFNNGDAVYSVGGGEADAGPRPVRAGSLNDTAYAWPDAEGDFSGATGAVVNLAGRIRVAYKPLTVHLLISGPKAFATNTPAPFTVALDPDVLLVPIEVARFFSPSIPVDAISMPDQMTLWDQVPSVAADSNTKSIDSGSGELTLTARTWAAWAKLTQEGLYEQSGWISPDSIWGKAKVRFRLVNYIDIQTDNEHAAPTTTGLTDDSILRDNHDTLVNHPQHIRDKDVVTVIYMFRIGPPDAPEIGRALLGEGAVGIAAGSTQRDADLAHEIGHLITGTDAHSTLPNNIMNNPGPGTDITPDQAQLARSWAQRFSDFWLH